MKFSDFPWLCSSLLPDPSEVDVLVLCNFSQLLLPYTPFHHPFVIKCTKCVFSFFNKINNSHATRTMHTIYRWPSTKFTDFPWLSRPIIILKCISKLTGKFLITHCKQQQTLNLTVPLITSTDVAVLHDNDKFRQLQLQKSAFDVYKYK